MTDIIYSLVFAAVSLPLVVSIVKSWVREHRRNKGGRQQ
jgi:hypothetical protein